MAMFYKKEVPFLVNKATESVPVSEQGRLYWIAYILMS